MVSPQCLRATEVFQKAFRAGVDRLRFMSNRSPWPLRMSFSKPVCVCVYVSLPRMLPQSVSVRTG